MKLYYSPGACSLAPHIVANEVGLPIETVKVDLATKKTAEGDYKAVNPKGYVPALKLNDGSVLTEAAVVCQYLAAQKPEAGLLPKPTTTEWYRMQEWFNFIATEIHKGFGPMWKPGTPAETVNAAKERLFMRFEFLNSHFQNGPFLLGSQFSAADAYLFTIMTWANYHKLDLSPYPALRSFMDRVGGRPGVQKALKEEGLI